MKKSLITTVIILCAFSINGIAQKALRFGSPGDYVDVPNSATLNPEQFTIEFWIRVTGLQSSDVKDGEQCVLEKRDWNLGGGYSIRLFGTRFPLGIALACDPNFTSIENVLPANKWCHVAVTRDNTTSRIYINGVLVASNSHAYSNKSNMPLRIGEYFSYPDLYYGLHGDIDELRIWDFPKTQSQISETIYSSLPGIQSGLMAYWNFDSDNLQLIKDRSLNSNNGNCFGNLKFVSVLFPSEFQQYLSMENESMKVKFDYFSPVIKSVAMKNNQDSIYGTISKEMFIARLNYGESLYDVLPITDTCIIFNGTVKYIMRAEFDSKVAAKFDLTFNLDRNSINLTFDNVTEYNGYHLIYVKTPDLVSVTADQEGAKMIFPECEGRLIDVKSSNQGYAEINLDMTGWRRPLLAAMIYYNNLSCVLNYKHLDEILWSRIFRLPGSNVNISAIGMTFNYRYAPSDFSKASLIDVFDSETTSLSVNLDFIKDFDNDGINSWIDGAKYLRGKINIKPDERYLNCFIGKLGVNGINSVKDHLTTIKKLYHLTDHNKIYLNLLDYGPLFELFGLEADLKPEWPLNDLKNVFQEACSSYNTILSFHDNYTDYFQNTPGYDPSLRVMQEDGSPRPGWPLSNFPIAYVADTYDYTTNYGIDRIRATLSRYPIKDTYHIDVLSLLFLRDYSSGSPSSREKNKRGVQMMINEFEKEGINITSEGLTGQYAESGMGFFLDVPRFTDIMLPFGNEQIIPFIEFVYHGKTLYGLYEDIYYDVLSPDKVAINKYLEPLLLGANSWVHITYQNPSDLEIEKFYFVDLPWMLLNQKFMEDYEENGSRKKISYNEGTFVEIDYAQNSYTVQVDGKLIAKDYATIYPKSDSVYLIFSRDQKTVSFQLPETWGKNIKLFELKDDGRLINTAYTLMNNNFSFLAKSYTPYKLVNSVITGINDSNSTIPQLNLLQITNYPNPFNNTTTITYYLPTRGNVSLDIFDVQGQFIKSLIKKEVMEPGYHSVNWNTNNLHPGIYYYKIQLNSCFKTNKAILIK